MKHIFAENSAMKRILGVLLLVISIAACNNNGSKEKSNDTNSPKSKADSLMADVMDGHDAGMSKYGRLRSRRNEIQAAIDSLSKLPVTEEITRMKQGLSQIVTELTDAIIAMDKWMEEFNMDSAVNNLNQRIDYLMNEKLKVNKVKDLMLKGLSNADSALNQLKL